MIEILITIGLLILGYFFGSHFEKRHYEDIFAREQHFRNLPVSVGNGEGINAKEFALVTGTVVIASDYFKNFIANLKNIFGGRLTSHESLLDRARREAVIRMKMKARHWGAREIVGMEMSTCFIDKFGIEVTVVGTAVK